MVLESLEPRWLLNGANEPPVAVDDAFSVGKNDLLVESAPGVLHNDSDPDDDALEVIEWDSSSALGRTVVGSSDGGFAYDPGGKDGPFGDLPGGETAEDTFVYVISDGHEGTDSATVTITVIGNSDPEAENYSYGVDEDEPLEVEPPGVLDLVSDPDGDPVEVTSVDTTDMVGELTWDADGSFTYGQQGEFDWLGVGETADTAFSYTVGDGKGGSDTATVTITIDGVNDDPVAVDRAYETDEKTNRVVPAPGLWEDVYDPDRNDELELSLDDDNTHGDVFVDAETGWFLYSPAGQFDELPFGETAIDSFTYTISDDKGGSNTATVTLTIHGVNDDPVAADRDFEIDEKMVWDVAAPGLLQDVVDPDTDDELTVIDVDVEGTEGVVTWDDDGRFTYDPNGQFNELQNGETDTDSFSYTVSDRLGATDTATVTITIVGLPNEDPEASDDAYETFRSRILSVKKPGLLLNDDDPNGDELSVQSVDTTDTKGLVAWDKSGAFGYNPFRQFDDLPPGEEAFDTFRYTVSDGEGGTDTATVTITVIGNSDPVAEDYSYDVDEKEPLEVEPPGVLDEVSDPDGDPVEVTSVDTTDMVGELLTWDADGSFTYGQQGEFDWLGVGETADTAFSYTVGDGKGGSDTATVTITIHGVNDDPVAVDRAYETEEKTNLVVPAPGLWEDVYDPDRNDELELSLDDGNTHGDVFVDAETDWFLYSPAGQFDDLPFGETAIDSFTYTISDDKGGSDTATVTLTIHGVNDPPEAADHPFTINEKEVLDEPEPGLLAGASDPDEGDDLTVVGVDLAGTVGSVTWHDDGRFTYDPNGQFNELQNGETDTDSFSYTVSDRLGATDTATVTITIVGLANDAPVAQDDSYGTDKSNFLVVPEPGVLANDDDPNPSDVLSVTSFDTTGTDGLVIQGSDGDFGYDPRGPFDHLQGNEIATDTFTYTVSDGEGGTDTATVTIRIKAEPNTPPTARPQSYTASEKDILLLPADEGLLVNDTDPDPTDELEVISVDTDSLRGKVAYEADGSFSYNPDGQFEYLATGEQATETFDYTISDGFGGTDSAVVTIYVQGENDPPVAGDDDEYSTDEKTLLDVPAELGLLDNDSDPDDSDVLTVISINDDALQGTIVEWADDGSFTYSPADAFTYLAVDETAFDTFTYTINDGHSKSATATVTITVHGVNDPPVAGDDEYSTDVKTPRDVPAELGLLDNDSDPDDSDGLTVTEIDTTGLKGKITEWSADGAFTYDPDGQFADLPAWETDTTSFTYQVHDGNDGFDTATATITITNETVQVSQVVINDGSDQRSMLTQLDVQFNTDVIIAAGAFHLVHRETGAVVDTSYATSEPDGKTIATLSFPAGPSVQERSSGNTLVDGNYQLTIDSSKVTRGDLQLDGDGQGGDYVFGAEEADEFYRLYGDAVGRDRRVNVFDLVALRSTYGKKSGDDGYRDEFDFNDDQRVNVFDLVEFRKRYGSFLGF